MTYRYLIGCVGLLFSLTATAGEPATSASIDASASRYSGTLMFNQASGDLHQQVNARAVSAGELPQIKVEQRLDGIPVDHASAAMQASILGNSFSGGSGVLGVNQSAGAANQQINGFRLGTAIRPESLDDSILAQSAALSPSSSAAESRDVEDRRVEIDDKAFAGSRGVVQLNQAAGVGNRMVNSLGIRILE